MWKCMEKKGNIKTLFFGKEIAHGMSWVLLFSPENPLFCTKLDFSVVLYVVYILADFSAAHLGFCCDTAS